MPFDRRHFLAHTARLLSLAAFPAAFPSKAVNRTADYPFSLGVASGSPRPTSVVLWTRILPDPLNGLSAGPESLQVQWEMAEDEAFTRIIDKGKVIALPDLAHSVHVEANGLRPDRWYWYRFMLGDAVSPIGRTRTAPAPDSMPASLRFAFASCQHWEFGEYGAHRHIAAEAPDLVAFLGDYIYEWGPYELTHPTAPRRRSHESITLADYRARYAQYKSDARLQAAHLAAPWMVTWDDHEVANDYANDRDERLDANFLMRRAAAYQAFYEHMPVRLSAPPDKTNRFARLRIYDRVDWGRLARFHVLDNRQYRSYHACQQAGIGGSTSISTACAERIDSSRTLLGAEQEAWLDEGFSTSTANWNFIAQQTLMAQASQVPILAAGDGRFWNDGWDGYAATRHRVFGGLARHGVKNPVVISGDVHTFYAADIRADFDRPMSGNNPVIATEFCGTSVTSGSRPQKRIDQYLAHNPHIKYGRSDRRGYAMVELTATRATVRFQGLDDVHRADSGVSTLARFVVDDGRPGVARAP